MALAFTQEDFLVFTFDPAYFEFSSIIDDVHF